MIAKMKMVSNKIFIPSYILHEIEESLNHPNFSGIAAGATLNDAMSVVFLNSRRVWNFRARVSDYFRYRYHRFHQPFTGTKDLSCYEGRIVFTWLFDRPDLKALVLPLVGNYACNDSVVVGSVASMQEKLPEKTAFVSWADFPKIDMKAWRAEFDRCQPIWRQRLFKVLDKHSIPQYVAEFLMTNLQVQTQHIIAAGQFLDVVRPKIIVTEYDRNTHSSCLILAAKQKGIPSITMVHGAAIIPPPRYGFVPVLADYVCCWGDRHKDNFIKHGVNQVQLIVTGCQGLTPTVDTNRDSSLFKIGLSLDKSVVLLATSPVKLEDRIEYTLAFCVAMSKLPEMTAIVRLHSAETVTEYQRVVNAYPNVSFMTNSEMSRDDALAAADIVVVHESSFGIDALLKGSVVVVFDALKDTSSTPLIIGKEMIEMAGCPMVKTANELADVIRKVMESEKFRSELHAGAAQYAIQYCHIYGQDAAKNVCRVIENAIESRKNNAASSMEV